MFQTQQIDLNKDEFDKLFEFYKDHEEHYVRQRAHILLLRDKGFGVSAISNSLWLEENYISLYIKAWFHFGFEGLLSNETENLFNRINEIETPKPIEIEPFIDWSKVFAQLKKSSKKIYSFFEKIILTIATFFLSAFLWVVTKIRVVDFKKFYIPFNQSVSNTLNINKDSNNNIVFQMINVFNGDKEGPTETESKVASTLEETKKQFLEIFQNQKEYLSNSQMIALFLALNDKVQQIKDKERRKRILAVLATAAAMYVYYNTTIKGGLVIFTFLSMSITIFNFDSCNNVKNNQNGVEGENLSSITSDSILQIQEREQFVIDSLKQGEEQKRIIDSLIRQQEIADSLAKIEIIEEDDNCYYLVKKNDYVSRLIEEDNNDHESENYFVARYNQDNKYFLIVKIYSDIREAAFQRKQLISHGFNKSKILEIEEDEERKFGLTVDEFTETKYDDAISLIYGWEQFCDDGKYKLTIYHNGLCKLR
ncbi:helix-turn-helix domain-containing protein [Flavobacterium filum]|uniref:helix-turn-helix domain-containing protein n=1 Tax=Flavobacterium filum TaxID=370974 RepID=UPI0023F02890|nr:helix-turn-helix domain-containing protein [Flavobacterium filum]